MAKFQSPLLGYNNNVRHKNRVFHIQTEDSGVGHPHIITHLFMDGGRILKSVKRSYAEHVGVQGMSEIVRGLMKDQHKAMFIALRDGQFDPLVEAAPSSQQLARAPAVPTPLREPPIVIAPKVEELAMSRIITPPAGIAAARTTASKTTARLLLVDAEADEGTFEDALPLTTRNPTPLVEASVPAREASPAPGRVATRERVSTRPIDGPRYAPARPAGIFGAIDTRPPPQSIFSEELLDDKSLDEVILSYLAEDLEASHE